MRGVYDYVGSQLLESGTPHSLRQICTKTNRVGVLFKNALQIVCVLIFDF